VSYLQAATVSGSVALAHIVWKVTDALSHVWPLALCRDERCLSSQPGQVTLDAASCAGTMYTI